MTIEEVLEQRFSFALKDLIPVTKIQNEEDKKKEKYLIDYTLSEWEAAYPFLPAEYIFYAPVLASTNLVYFDEEKYIWLNLPIAGKEILYNGQEDFEHYIKSVIAQQQKAYENKEFIPLFITMPDSIRMEIICQMPRRADAKGLFYKTFKEFYPISTCFTNRFPTTIGRLLMYPYRKVRALTHPVALFSSRSMVTILQV